MRLKIVRITTVPISFRLLLTNQLEFFQAHGFDVYAVSGKDDISGYPFSGTIPFIQIPFTRRISPFADLICLIKLIRILKQIKPHIVHTHTPKAGFLGMMAAWLCGVPIRLHTVAGLPWIDKSGVSRKIFMFIEWLTYFFSTSIYPNSVGLTGFIQSVFPSFCRKIKIIGKGSSNGIDVAYFSPDKNIYESARAIRAQYHIPDHAIVIGFVGRLVRDKGIGELLAAFKLIVQENTGVYLMLVGPEEPERDPLLPADRAFITSHPNIIAPGFQEDVRPWLMSMDVFVFPSYREGFPNALLQAACMSRACIATNINGNDEIIQDKFSGILVPVKDIENLKNAIRFLIQDKNLRELYGQRAREFVIAHFSRQLVWQELLNEYNTFKCILEKKNVR